MKSERRVHTATIIDVVSTAVLSSLSLSQCRTSLLVPLSAVPFLALGLSPLTLVTQTRKPFRHQCCRLI